MSPFNTFPEELLEAIFIYVIFSNPTVVPLDRSLLLVSKAFYRISVPLYFHTIHIRSQAQLRKLLDLTLRPNPELASYIRKLVLDAVWREAGDLIDLCSRHSNMRVLDVTLDGPSFATVRTALNRTQPNETLRSKYHDLESVDEFCKQLQKLTFITHLTVRKCGSVYLTQTRSRFFLSNLAKAMIAWKDLEFVELAFRLSDDSGDPYALLAHALPHPPPAHHSTTTSPPTAKSGPLTHLTHTLSTLPNLHTFVTLLPNVWNENILRVSRNPALERIVLVESSRIGFNYPFIARTNPNPWPIGTAGNSVASPTYSAKDLYPGPVSACMPGPGSGSQGSGAHTHHLDGLYASGNDPHNYGIPVTGRFYEQAKNYPRLCELIKAGMRFAVGGSPLRTRARTLGTPSSSSVTYPVSTSLSPRTDTDSQPRHHPLATHSNSPPSQPSCSSSCGSGTGAATAPIQVSASMAQIEDMARMRLSTSVP